MVAVTGRYHPAAARPVDLSGGIFCAGPLYLYFILVEERLA